MIVSQYDLGVCEGSPTIGQEDGKREISRNHPFAARILRRWRALSGGKGVRDADRLTLVACSGGADSVALAAVLAMVEPKPVLAHVLHDIRDDGSAEKDRDFVRELAKQLGCGYLERKVEVRACGGNVEGNARRLRYRALCEMADECGARYIVSGHHCDDQLETLLMRLMRGTGVRGLGGVSPKRSVGNQVLLRPMLEVGREEIVSFCQQAGLAWREDPTNEDVGYLRNRIRHEVIPVLKNVEPAIASRGMALSESSRQMSEAIERVVEQGYVSEIEVGRGEWCFDRHRLRVETPAVLVELIFAFARHEMDSVGVDSINQRSLDSFISGVKSDEVEPRSYRVGPIVVSVRARKVEMKIAGGNEDMKELE